MEGAEDFLLFLDFLCLNDGAFKILPLFFFFVPYILFSCFYLLLFLGIFNLLNALSYIYSASYLFKKKSLLVNFNNFLIT